MKIEMFKIFNLFKLAWFEYVNGFLICEQLEDLAQTCYNFTWTKKIVGTVWYWASEEFR